MSTLNLILLSPVPMAILWGNDGILLYNDAYGRFAGRRHPELLGRDVYSGWPEASAFNHEVMDVVLAGSTLTYSDSEMTLYRNDRPEKVWMNLQYSPILGEAGQPLGVLCVVAEITEQVAAEQRRERAEDALRAERDRAQGVLDNMGEAFVLLDRDYRIVDLNSEALRLEGRPKNEVVGKTHWEAHPDAAPELGELYQAAMRERRAASLRHRYTWPDGRNSWIEMRAFPVIEGLAVFYGDVTGRVTAEEQLRESEARFRGVFDSGVSGFTVFDANTGATLAVNDRFLAMTGHSRADFDEGRWDWRQFTLDEYLPLDEAAIAQARQQGWWYPYEKEYRRVDGTCFPVRLSSAALPGEPGRVVVAIEDLSETRAAARLLRENEEKLRLATDAAEIGLWDVDVITDRLDWPPRVKAMFSIAPDAIVTMADFYAGLHADDRERVTDAFAAAADPERRAVYDVEYCAVGRDDGHVRWVAAKGRGVFSDAGVCTRVIGTAIDVTGRKSAEEALRASEARMKLAQQTAHIGVWDWDVTSGAITWSPEMYEILGLDAVRHGNAPYAAWLDLMHPADRERADAAAQRAASHGEAFDIMFRITRASVGDERWIRSHGAAVVDAAGRPVRVVGVNLDVTDERRREEELRALAGNLQSAVEETRRQRDRMFELSKDLFAVAGFDGFLVTVNPAWTALLGHSSDYLLKTPFADFIHPDDLPTTGKVLAALQRGDPVNQFYVRLIKADGTPVSLAWSAVPESTRNAGTFYTVGRDITDELRREEAFRQSQKMEAVGQLTGGIAHDFNNVLQGVQGNLDLIRRSPSNTERVARWAANALSATERGTKLTAQLLAFSRAQKLELRAVAIGALITGMDDMLQRSLGPMVRVVLDPGPAGLGVLVDPTQLEMALLNLAINARDAMPGGGALVIAADIIEITEGDAELAPGHYVEIRVSDDGVGMPADVAARAFDPFFTTKSVGKGTGLGLSQVYGMARQAGGIARITARHPRGTTVSLVLVAVEVEQHSDGGIAHEVVKPAPVSRRILVVDDDAEVRQFLSDSLDSLGFEVATAADGETGLAMLSRQLPDLLLVDFAMPGMSGADLAERARGLSPALPIVFATGYSETAAITAAVGTGAPLLKKPFSISELEQVLRTVMA